MDIAIPVGLASLLYFHFVILPFNHLSANPIKWSDTFKQFNSMNCLSVFDHFVKLVVKGLRAFYVIQLTLI